MIGQTTALQTYANYNGKWETKWFNNKLWLKVYYHDISGGYWPNNLYTCLDNQEEKRFSILGYVDKFTYCPGIYEYLLEYPGYTGYNQWRQTNLPWTTLNSVLNYNAISISWSGSAAYSTDGCFWGITRSAASSSTMFDGMKGGSWFYAYCSFNAWSGGIPGPYNAMPNTGVPKAQLWLRIG